MSVRIRPVSEADAAALAAIYAPYVSETTVSFEKDPPDAAEFLRRIRSVTEFYPWLVYEADGVVLGYAYASPQGARYAYRTSAYLSVYADREHLHRGIGRALYGVLLELLRRMGIHAVWAAVSVPNPPSEGLHTALGFSRVGLFPEVGRKFDEWMNLGWFSKILSPEPAPALRAFSSLSAEERRAAGLSE